MSFKAFNFHSNVVAGVVDEGYENGICQILGATDIAARGIDVTRISHVINYDIPSIPEAYVHRIGEAFTFITEDDNDMVCTINESSVL